MSSNFNDRLGLRRAEDGSGVVLDPRPEHLIAPGTIHFAVLTTVAEVAEGEVVQGNRLVAKATVTFAILD